MIEYVEVPLPEGGSLVVQADEDLDAGEVPAGRIQDIAARASETFESAMDRIRGAAGTVTDRMQRMPQPADEITVQFSVKLATAVGVVIANTSAEANLTVSLKWTRADGAAPPEITPVDQPSVTGQQTS